jgi:hypothetical protein
LEKRLTPVVSRNKTYILATISPAGQRMSVSTEEAKSAHAFPAGACGRLKQGSGTRDQNFD